MSRLSGAVMQMRGQQHVLDTMERGSSMQAITNDFVTSTGEHVSTVNLQAQKVTLSYEALPAPCFRRS